MEEEEVDVVDLDARRRQRFLQDLGHSGHGVLEDMAPVHAREMAFFVDHFPGEAARHIARGGCLDPESTGVLALGVQGDVENAGRIGFLFRRLENDRARAVAEDYSHVSAFGGSVYSSGLHFAAHHHDPLRLAGLDQSIGKIQRVDESAALGAKVDTGHVARVQLLVEKKGSARKFVLGRQGGQ